jgi:hypothetical protein
MLTCRRLLATVFLAALAAPTTQPAPAVAPPAIAAAAPSLGERDLQFERSQAVRFDGQPGRTLDAGTRKVTVKLRTSKASHCRAAYEPGDFDCMPYDMTTRDGLEHELTIGGLQDGTVYSLYVRARDERGVETTWGGDYEITFAVRDARSAAPTYVGTTDPTTGRTTYSPATAGNGPSRHDFSIEQATLRPPMALSTDEQTGVTYAAFADVRTGPQRAPGRRRFEAGDISFSFVAPAVNDYVIWARVFLPDAKSDTFGVQVDGHEADTFDAAWQQPHGQWVWQAVNGRDRRPTTQRAPRIFVMDKGRHTVTFTGAAGGARLSKIIITDDLAFEPKD